MVRYVVLSCFIVIIINCLNPAGTVFELCASAAQTISERHPPLRKVKPKYKANCKYVLKLFASRSEADIKREENLSKVAGDLKCAPYVYDVGRTCKSNANPKLFIGSIIMDRWDMSLLDWLKDFGAQPDALEQNLPWIMKQIKSKVDILYSHGIEHGDLSLANALVNLDKRKKLKALCLTDFGKARRIFSSSATVEGESKIEKLQELAMKYVEKIRDGEIHQVSEESSNEAPSPESIQAAQEEKSFEQVIREQEKEEQERVPMHRSFATLQLDDDD